MYFFFFLHYHASLREMLCELKKKRDTRIYKRTMCHIDHAVYFNEIFFFSRFTAQVPIDDEKRDCSY